MSVHCYLNQSYLQYNYRLVIKLLSVAVVYLSTYYALSKLSLTAFSPT